MDARSRFTDFFRCLAVQCCDLLQFSMSRHAENDSPVLGRFISLTTDRSEAEPRFVRRSANLRFVTMNAEISLPNLAMAQLFKPTGFGSLNPKLYDGGLPHLVRRQLGEILGRSARRVGLDGIQKFVITHASLHLQVGLC